MDLSIVIPVYNTEKFIRKCLDSLCSQQIPADRYEIIVVNDGTKDKAIPIVREFIAKYSNIRLIEQENQGLSVARNTGLKESRGKYIWFFDSDDWARPNSIQAILSHIEHQPDADVFVARLARVSDVDYSEKIDKVGKYIEGKTVMEGKDYLFDEGAYAPMQKFILKREFLIKNNLFFYPGIYHEDGQYGMRTMYLCKKIVIIPEILYNYLLRNSGSTMSSMTIKNAKDLLLIHKTLLEFSDKHVAPEDIPHWRGVISSFISVTFHWLAFLADDPEFKRFIKENKGYYNKYIWDKLRKKHFHKFDLKNAFLITFAPIWAMKHNKV